MRTAHSADNAPWGLMTGPGDRDAEIVVRARRHDGVVLVPLVPNHGASDGGGPSGRLRLFPYAQKPATHGVTALCAASLLLRRGDGAARWDLARRGGLEQFGGQSITWQGGGVLGDSVNPLLAGNGKASMQHARRRWRTTQSAEYVPMSSGDDAPASVRGSPSV